MALIDSDFHLGYAPVINDRHRILVGELARVGDTTSAEL